jgi:D-inositol-3-phosphate glycosyltransferase
MILPNYIKRLAILSVHTSPLASLGGSKAGGMNVYIAEFAQELARRGVQIDIYTRRMTSETPEIDTLLGDNIRVISLPAGPQRAIDPNDVYPYLSQFAAEIIAFSTAHDLKYDLIYSHYWLSGWVAHKLNAKWGIPFVHMFHTLGQMKNRVVSGQMPIYDERTAIEVQITQWASRIIAATPAEHAQLLWLYRAKRRKIVIVPPGVNTKRFHPIPQEEAKANIGLSPEQKLLLFVGRIEPLKAVDTILEAISLLKQNASHLLNNTVFAIIGGDPANTSDSEMSRLLDLSRKLDLSDTVNFLGAKNQELLPDYYAAATAVIMPSDYESFGMVALEAMASGTPVIASEVGGLAFLVRNNETGFLVPAREPHCLAERIAVLLSKPHLRQELGRKAAEVAQQYVWSRIVDELLPVFEDVVNERAAGHK